MCDSSITPFQFQQISSWLAVGKAGLGILGAGKVRQLRNQERFYSASVNSPVPGLPPKGAKGSGLSTGALLFAAGLRQD